LILRVIPLRENGMELFIDHGLLTLDPVVKRMMMMMMMMM
jgi:hypothetical protein